MSAHPLSGRRGGGRPTAPPPLQSEWGRKGLLAYLEQVITACEIARVYVKRLAERAEADDDDRHLEWDMRAVFLEDCGSRLGDVYDMLGGGALPDRDLHSDCAWAFDLLDRLDLLAQYGMRRTAAEAGEPHGLALAVRWHRG
jgi:hypothetical protein